MKHPLCRRPRPVFARLGGGCASDGPNPFPLLQAPAAEGGGAAGRSVPAWAIAASLARLLARPRRRRGGRALAP